MTRGFAKSPFRSRVYLVAAIAMVGCAEPTSPADELRGAEQRWEAWGPASYDLTIHPGCECLLEAVVVQVRSGTVTARTYLSGSAVPDGAAGQYPDVKGLFARIRSELAENHIGSVEYDQIAGYPKRIVFDYDGPDIFGVDGEVFYNMILAVR